VIEFMERLGPWARSLWAREVVTADGLGVVSWAWCARFPCSLRLRLPRGVAAVYPARARPFQKQLN
jgi:hypothetical protein